MVFQLPFRFWTRVQDLRSRRGALLLACLFFIQIPIALGGVETPSAHSALQDAQKFYQSGQYFKAARYAFAAGEENPALQPLAYAWVTSSLVQAGLYNTASYFFIRTLQTADKPTIRRVLTHTQELLVRVGADVLRKYLIRHTTYEDYDSLNRSAYLYSLGKDALLKGKA